MQREENRRVPKVHDVVGHSKRQSFTGAEMHEAPEDVDAAMEGKRVVQDDEAPFDQQQALDQRVVAQLLGSGS